MEHQQPDDIDRQVRESFGIEPAAVRRIVAGARVAAARQPSRDWVLPTGLGAAVVLTLAAAIAWWPRPVAVPAPADLLVFGSLSDDVLVLTWPDGSMSIVSGDRRGDRPPDGSGIVLVEGDGR